MKVRDRLARRGDDGGFTLIEVMVASLLFIVLATSATLALGQLMKASGTAEARVVATSLATRQIETARSIAATAITNSSYTVTRGGRTYTVAQTAALDTAAGTGSACEGVSGAAGFQRVTVNVTWPGMGSTPPVRTDTVRALPISGAVGGLGTLTFAVRDRNGVPVKDQPVILRKGATTIGTMTTRDDGCAVFGGLTPGTDYSASLSNSGYVDNKHLATSVRAPLSVQANYVTKDPGWSWDRSMGMQVTVATPSGYPIPAGLPLTLVNTGLTGGGATLPVCSGTNNPCTAAVGGPTWTVPSVFPHRDGYLAFSGACRSVPPSSPLNLASTPGGVATGNAPALGGVEVRRGGTLAITGSGLPVFAENVDCPGERYQFPTNLFSTGNTKLGLPPGRWQIKGATGTVGATVTVTSAATQTVTVSTL